MAKLAPATKLNNGRSAAQVSGAGPPCPPSAQPTLQQVRLRPTAGTEARPHYLLLDPTDIKKTLHTAQQVFWPFLLSRLWTAFFVYIGQTREDLGPVGRIWPGVHPTPLHPWTVYDSQWFLQIAGHGYQPLTTAFYPLYPLLLRIAGPDEARMALWGVVVSNLCCFLGLTCFYKLTALDYNESIARRAVWCLAFFPLTAFFSAVYTESLFLVCIVATFYCVRLNRWAGAGCWGLLAALTRNSGLVIAAALVAEYLRPRSAVAARPPKSALGFASLPFWGFLLVQLCFALQFGGLLVGAQSQKTFGRALGWPWIPVWRDCYDVVTGRALDPTTLINLCATLLAFYFVARYWRAQPLAYSILVLGTTLMNLVYALHQPPYTAGAARYMMTAFPFTQLIAVESDRFINSRFSTILAVSLYLALCALLSFIFGVRAFVA